MKALVYHGPEDLRYEDVATPEPGDGQVRLKIGATGICGSDVHGYAGLTGRRLPPMIMGHEFVGTVEKLGPGVKSLKPGDRVVPFPIISCGHCEACLSGAENKCFETSLYGVLSRNGSFAEYLCINEKQATLVSNQLTDAEAAMAEPLAVALHGIRQAHKIEGKHVVVAGAGTIGLFVVALLKTFKPASIIVSDLNAYRLEIASKMGADVVVKADQLDLKEVVYAHTNQQGADVSIECVGITPTVRQAMDVLKIGGQSVWVGNSSKIIETDMQAIVTHEWQVTGSFLYTRKDFSDVIAMLENRQLDISPIISKEITLEEGPDMFHTLYKNPGNLIKVVVR